ncbi:MAG: nickel-binding protein [Anaerolineae bacterium]
MTKFLAIHRVGGDMTLEAGTPIAQSIKAHLTADAYWLRSYYAPEAGALYCVWDAKDAEAISQVLADAAPDLPTEGPYEITMYIHSEDFR